jgi:hypothetical protein
VPFPPTWTSTLFGRVTTALLMATASVRGIIILAMAKRPTILTVNLDGIVRQIVLDVDLLAYFGGQGQRDEILKAISAARTKQAHPVLDFIERHVASSQPTATGATWAVYDIKSRPAKLVGIVSARDKRAAVARANREHNVSQREGGRLMVVRQG